MWVMRSRLGSVLLVGLVGDLGKEATHVVILLGQREESYYMIVL